MINLMPDDSKKEIRAARTNVILSRYIIIVIFAIVFLGLVNGGAYYILDGVKKSAETAIASNSSNDTSYGSVQAEVDTLKQSLTGAQVILDQEVRYSKVLTTISSLVPSGVILDSISLSQAKFDTPVTLQAYAKTTADANALQTAFAASPSFANVKIQSISSQSSVSGYPVSATLNLTILKAATK